MRQWTLSLAVLALFAGTSFAGKYNTKLSVGDKAPVIAGLKAAEGDKDTTLTLSDIKDDVVVVAFLANHCPAVVGNEDRMIDVAKNFKGKSVKFVNVCCSESSGDADDVDGIAAIKTKFKEGKYLSVNTVYGIDPAGKVGKAYGAIKTPQFFVLDKTRTIKYMGGLDDSPMNPDKATKPYLKLAIDAVLNNETVEVTEAPFQGCGIQYKR